MTLAGRLRPVGVILSERSESKNPSRFADLSREVAICTVWGWWDIQSTAPRRDFSEGRFAGGMTGEAYGT